MRLKKSISISLGDPSGIGAEVFLKAVFKSDLKKSLDQITIFSDPQVIVDMLKRLSINAEINVLSEKESNKPNCLNIALTENSQSYTLGKPVSNNASYIISNIEAASKFAAAKNANLVTGPINKKIISSVFPDFCGHTDYLKKLFLRDEVLMVLSNSRLRVGLITTHIPLADVHKSISFDKILKKGVLFANGLKHNYGISNPKICVLSLNPHSGEQGSIGTEEIEIISPAVEALRKNDINAFGPVPADTAFLRSEFDGFLSMYHDQGLPVIKTVDFHGTINSTFGLPFLRTSVDHGTAEDIADKLIANHQSMLEAIKVAGNVH